MAKQTLWVAPDGLVVFHRIEWATVYADPIKAERRENKHEAWCNVVRDALLERRWQDVYRMLEKHDDDELTYPDDERPTLVLPLYEADSLDEAKMIRTLFCSLGIGSHPWLPLGERWYYLSRFDGTIESLFAYQDRIVNFIQTRNAKQTTNAILRGNRRR